MGPHIPKVIPLDAETAYCVIDSEGKADERPSREWVFTGRVKDGSECPEISDRWVLFDRAPIVEEERRRDAVRIEREGEYGDDDRYGPPAATTRPG
jgi:hypothetical protein